MDGLTLVAVLVLVALLPVWVGALVRLGTRMYARWEQRRSHRHNDPVGLPIERLSSDLHRLQAELDRIERSDQPMKVARLRATSLAYDDLLLAACRALEVEPRASPPLRAFERLEVEADLVRAGLRW